MCAGDRDLGSRIVASLLAYHDVGAFLEWPVSPFSATWDAPNPLEAPGAIIDPYKLLQPKELCGTYVPNLQQPEIKARGERQRTAPHLLVDGGSLS